MASPGREWHFLVPVLGHHTDSDWRRLCCPRRLQMSVDRHSDFTVLYLQRTAFICDSNCAQFDESSYMGQRTIFYIPGPGKGSWHRDHPNLVFGSGASFSLRQAACIHSPFFPCFLIAVLRKPFKSPQGECRSMGLLSFL